MALNLLDDDVEEIQFFAANILYSKVIQYHL